MSDAYNFLPSFFSEDKRTGAPTYAQLEARRKIAMALATRNRPYPKTIGEGLTALGEGLGEGINLNRLERADAAQTVRDAEAGRPPPGTSYVPGAPAAPGQTSSIEDPATNALAMASPDEVLAAVPPDVAKSMPPQAKLASMPVGELKQRLARNETGGHPDPYRAIGPRSRRDDFPYGKYQVMGENIPKWTKTYLGKELTPQEFLDSEEAQERVADGQAGKYLAKYGPIGAAEAWFAGERGRIEGRSTRKDTLGTHIDEYVRRFNIPLVSRDQVAASAVNAPPAAPAMAFVPGEESSDQPPVQLPGQVAALDTGAMSDAAPVKADPRVGVVNSLVAQQQPAMQPGIGPDTLSAAPPSPQQPQIAPAPRTPSVPPSREPIPPASLEVMPDPGPEPTRPGPLPPSDAQRYWAKQLDDPYLSTAAKERAARMYSTEDAYRKEIQSKQAEEYKNAREKWEAATLAKQKHDREEPKRGQEELIRRLNIEKEQALAANRPTEAAKLQAELDNALRTLNKPDTVAAGGTQFERPYAPPGSPQTPYAVPPGLPKPKEDLTETQAKATTFIVRTKPDLDRVDTEMKGGAALTSMKDAALDALGPMGSGNIVISDDYRRARDALGNWGAAFLTHVSGAAVSPSEALRNLPAFIPRPGDNERDLKDKADRRRNMMDAIATGTGDVGMKKVHEMNDAYEYRKNGEKAPVPVQKIEEAKTLPQGTRIILPDGSPGRVPARKRDG